MKTEFEKMRSEEFYDFTDPEILSSLNHSKRACQKLNQMILCSPGYRDVLQEIIPDIPDDSKVCPPFHCDHGNGIKVGHNVFINYNCCFLDGAFIYLGDNVRIGPMCQLYTVSHPIDPILRRGTVEVGYPVSIGADTWLGGGVIVCPGVKIGKRCIVGAGSVVVHDVPDDCMVAGNPAVIKKRLNER